MKKLMSLLICVALLISAVSITVFAESDAEAKIGDIEYATLLMAVQAANENADVTTIELLKDVTTTQLNIEEETVINGNGHSITTNVAKKTFEVYADFTVNDIEIVNNFNYGRCIDTRVGGITLNVNNSILTGTSALNPQPITIGGNAGTADNVITVNVDGSEISALGGYGIITFNPVNMTITNSNVTGFGALYMKGADGSVGSNGSVVSIEGSVMHSVNTMVDSTNSNSFSTIVLEDNEIAIAIDGDSTISCSSSGDQAQYLIVTKREYDPTTGEHGDHVTGNVVIVEDGAKLEAVASGDATAEIIAGTIINVTEDTIIMNVVAVPSEYAEAVYNEGAGYITAIDPETGLSVITFSNSDFTTIIGHTHSAENMTKVDSKDATCTEDGVIEHYICEECEELGYLYGDEIGSTIVVETVIAATGHTLEKVDAVAATTEKEGNIAHYKCADCGTLFADENGEKELSAKDVITTKLAGKKEPTDNGKVDTNTKSPATSDNLMAVATLVMSAVTLFGATLKIRK
ncbi:MAG: hypothetical protein IJZ21_01240 [Clostridia bacterium]|nr:hypothetical protein [Clostridia bacterium]